MIYCTTRISTISSEVPIERLLSLSIQSGNEEISFLLGNNQIDFKGFTGIVKALAETKEEHSIFEEQVSL